MTHDPQDVLRRFHMALVREIKAGNPEYLGAPFSVAEIYQNLIPYRTHREKIGVEMNADYEHALLQLLAGEGDYLTIESRTARQEIREELESPNPNTGLYRDFAAADVRLNPEKVDEALMGWEVPETDSEDEMEDVPEAPDFLPAEDEEKGEEPMEDEADMEVEVGEVDSQGLPLELSDQEDPPPVDAVSLDGEDLIEEELAPAVPESTSSDTCPWCRENLPGREGVKFCPFCGSNVQLVPCPDCGEELELSWRFCIACGTEVSS